MEQRTGTLERIDVETGTSKAGKPYKRWVFTIDGSKYSSFDESIADGLDIGKKVYFSGEQSGKFFNIKDIRHEQILNAPSPSHKIEQTLPFMRLDIIRAAIELVKAKGLKDFSIEEFFKICNEIEEHIKTG